jgi:hypothetical protein
VRLLNPDSDEMLFASSAIAPAERRVVGRPGLPADVEALVRSRWFCIGIKTPPA